METRGNRFHPLKLGAKEGVSLNAGQSSGALGACRPECSPLAPARLEGSWELYHH